MKKITDFVDELDTESFYTKSAEKMKEKVPEDSVFVDLCFRDAKYPNSDKICPCLNTKGQLFNMKMGRFANVKEYCKLQGFPKNFKKVVSSSQLKKQLGNSMSVNVLVKIFKELHLDELY